MDLLYFSTALDIVTFKSNTLEYELGLPSDTPALLQGGRAYCAGAAPTVHGIRYRQRLSPQLGAPLTTRTLLLVDDCTFLVLWPFTKSQG